MTETVAPAGRSYTSPPNTSPPTPSQSLDDLANKIKGHVKTIDGMPRQKLKLTLEIGEWLLQAKKTIGHGNWATWLKQSCELTERTAQRYMELAEGREIIKAKVAKMKSVTVSDLSLRQAQRLLKPDDDNNDDTAKDKLSDAYDKAQEKLIEKLEALMYDVAEAAAEETKKQLDQALGVIAKREKKAATKKAA
jgi:hypothetical protein